MCRALAFPLTPPPAPFPISPWFWWTLLFSTDKTRGTWRTVQSNKTGLQSHLLNSGQHKPSHYAMLIFFVLTKTKELGHKLQPFQHKCPKPCRQSELDNISLSQLLYYNLLASGQRIRGGNARSEGATRSTARKGINEIAMDKLWNVSLGMILPRQPTIHQSSTGTRSTWRKTLHMLLTRDGYCCLEKYLVLPVRIHTKDTNTHCRQNGEFLILK